MINIFARHKKSEVDNQVYEALTRYTVGFLAHTKDQSGRGKHTPWGSGVLADIGDVKGIITAAHVVRTLRDFSRVTLFTVPRPNKKVRRLDFDPKNILAVANEGMINSPEGPDLAFMQLPFEVRDAVVAENAFYSFEQRLEHSSRSNIPLTHHFLSGIIEKRS